MSPVSHDRSAAVAVWMTDPSLRQVSVVPTGTETTCGVKLYSYVNVVPSNGRPPYTGVCGGAAGRPVLGGGGLRAGFLSGAPCASLLLVPALREDGHTSFPSGVVIPPRVAPPAKRILLSLSR